jgi:flagellar biosynthesis anti-sigma factor FlgM
MMRIDSNAMIQKVASLRPKSVGAVDGAAGVDGDSVELSARAADVRAAMEALQAAPAVRTDRVAELARQLEQGTLTTDGESLAAKLLKKA